MKENFGDMFWINKVEQKISEVKDLYDLVIITDVRFENEMISIIQKGGTILYIDRDQKLGKLDETIAHVSETAVLSSVSTGYSCYSQSFIHIKNNSNKEDLKKELNNFFSQTTQSTNQHS